MDKLPRLGRKPKPPAIETSVDRTSSDTGDSTFSTEITAQPPPQKNSMRKSPLRNLKLRVTAKRARTHSPAALPSSSPVVAVFKQDGITPRTAMEESPSALGSSRPVMPAFLAAPMQNVDAKFLELTWAERNRVAQGTRPDATSDSQWSSFKQTDGASRGVMDRYVNIKPWNHNRVKLKVAEDEFDYVNASTISLDPLGDKSLPPLRYIAMQGPTEPSIDCVWRMVAEQTSSPAVIVQLTSMEEGGMTKCNQYFPANAEEPTWDLNEDNVWNDNWKARLTYDSFEDLADGAIEKRKLLLHVQGEAEPRVVWHLLYTRWPDYGVPLVQDMDSFFELMPISRELSKPSNPRIIHCSAGVGRTGTFISLEHLMRELDEGTLEANSAKAKNIPDPIYHTVDTLRQQRRCMVQSDSQYRFLHDVMRKLWQDKYGIALDGHDADGTGNSEPAPKRLEVADPLSETDDSNSVGETGPGGAATKQL